MKHNFSTFFLTLKSTLSSWQQDNLTIWCASLAYFTIFSLGPLLFLVINIIGLIFRHNNAAISIYAQINGLIGPSSAHLIEGLINNSAKSSSGLIGNLLGIITLLLGAIGVFGQLQQMLNHIWQVTTKPSAGFISFLRDRFLSFAMIGVIAFLLLVSLLASSVISVISTFFKQLIPFPVIFLELINIVISLGVITLLFGFIFKFLPDIKISWKNVWIGSFLTAILFTIGKTLIGLYIGHSGITSTYGAAASLVILLLWVYYSTQILSLGAEFTKVYTLKTQGKITPNKYASLTSSSTSLKKTKSSKEETSFATNITRNFFVGLTKGLFNSKPKKKSKH